MTNLALAMDFLWERPSENTTAIIIASCLPPIQDDDDIAALGLEPDQAATLRTLIRVSFASDELVAATQEDCTTV
jgi:hypothetical protein